jgi:Dyp-type peroxidase family
MDLSDIQGLVFHPYRRMRYAAYVMLRFRQNHEAEVRNWLGHLINSQSLDSATPKEVGPRGRPGLRVNVAFTYTGLVALGLHSDALNTFPLAFVEGLGAKWKNGKPDHRSRALGDEDPDNWDWGYHGWKVDAALLIFATEETILRGETGQWIYSHGAHQAIEDSKVLFGTFPEEKKPVKEPFGFVDGVSQPVLKGAMGQLGEKDKPTQPPRHALDDGEILLGHVDGARQIAASPTVGAAHDPSDMLPESPDDPERHDIGYNGTYLVFRQLAQDSEKFDKGCAAAAASVGIPVDRFKALLVGRWQDGSPLMKCPVAHDPDHATAPSGNDFDYSGDPHGERCPVGAHVRRANPRDSLGDDPEKSWQLTNRHRILRRGRPYKDAQNNEGIHFICLNASIERQFEFIQQNWINDSSFGGLNREDDPIVGPRLDNAKAGSMTLPPPAETRLRRRVGVPELKVPGLSQFVTVKGGGYFFLPSLTALRYLAHLPAAGPRREWTPQPQNLSSWEWVRFLFIVRFQMLFALILGAAPLGVVFGSQAITRPMFQVSRPLDLLIVTVLASLSASLLLTAYRVATLYAEARFGVHAPPSRALTWNRVLLWQAVSVPVVATTLWLSAQDAVVGGLPVELLWPLVRFGLAVLQGYALAWLILLGAEAIRSLAVRPKNVEDAMFLPPLRLLAGLKGMRSNIPTFGLVRFIEGTVARWPPDKGAGYVDHDKGRILPGHLAAGVLAAGISVLYLVGWFLLWPPSDFQLPPSAYTLFVFAIAGSAAAAVAFFLDRFRVPILTVLLAIWIAATYLGGSDHEFIVLANRNLPPAPTVNEAILRADSYHPDSGGTDPTARPIVVVAAGGGGAHQAAWTVRVLTGLTKLWGTRFTGNLRLVSGVSAGSVGAMHFVLQFQNAPPDSQSGAGGEGGEDKLQKNVVDAAKSAATGDVWWGITYPDLTRTLWPVGAFVPGTLDRGRTLELAWCRAMGLDSGCRRPTMGEWQADVESGKRPAVAFNAMVVETGERAVLATYRRPINSTAKDLGSLTGQKDVPVITAARLSATFPYITPAARPESGPQRVHLIDGGYWDNHAIVTVLEWLAEANVNGRPVLVVRIPPPSEPVPNPGERAWPWQTIAPLQAVLSMRTNAQRNRNDFDMKLFNQAHNMKVVLAEFPYQGGNSSTDSLLSWHLSRRERCGIEKAWDEEYGQAANGGNTGDPPAGAAEINKIASILNPPAKWTPPVVEECAP